MNSEYDDDKERNEVKIIHLITGPPIIGKCRTVNQGCVYLIEDPLYLYWDANASSQNGKDTFSVNNLLALSDETSVKIDKDKVLFSYYPAKSLLEHYNNSMINQLELID